MTKPNLGIKMWRNLSTKATTKSYYENPLQRLRLHPVGKITVACQIQSFRQCWKVFWLDSYSSACSFLRFHEYHSISLGDRTLIQQISIFVGYVSNMRTSIRLAWGRLQWEIGQLWVQDHKQGWYSHILPLHFSVYDL